MTKHYYKLTLSEICMAVHLPEHELVELVQHDIVNPIGEAPDVWVFDTAMVGIAKRAARLQRDLELDWAAIAVIEKLIEQREELQSENLQLRARLQRFLEDF